jgi:hypothetical protein
MAAVVVEKVRSPAIVSWPLLGLTVPVTVVSGTVELVV